MSEAIGRIRKRIETHVTTSPAKYLTPAPSLPGKRGEQPLLDVRNVGLSQKIEPVALDASLSSLGVTAQMLDYVREECAQAFSMDGLRQLITLFRACQTVQDVVNEIEAEYYRALVRGAGALNLAALPEELQSDTPVEEFPLVSAPADESRQWDLLSESSPTQSNVGAWIFIGLLVILAVGTALSLWLSL